MEAVLEVAGLVLDRATGAGGDVEAYVRGRGRLLDARRRAGRSVPTVPIATSLQQLLGGDRRGRRRSGDPRATGAGTPCGVATVDTADVVTPREPTTHETLSSVRQVTDVTS